MTNQSLRMNNIHRIAKAVNRIYLRHTEENRMNYHKSQHSQLSAKKVRKRKRPRRHSSLDMIEIPIEKSTTETTKSSF